MRNTPVVHLGVPGLCFGCDGSGVQRWVDAVAITAELQRRHDRHVAEINQAIADCQAGIAATTRAFTVKVFQREIDSRTAQLATMQAAVKPATRGEWRPAARQTVKAA